MKGYAALARLMPAAFAALLVLAPVADAQTADGNQQPLGNGCAYVEIPGTATITGIEKTPESTGQATVNGGPGYEGLEIRYTFAPTEPVADPQVEDWIKQPHVLQLANSWYPGPRYIEKYGLAAGKSMDAVLKVQTAGSCSPYTVDFPDLDLTDYFETASLLRAMPVLAALR